MGDSAAVDQSTETQGAPEDQGQEDGQVVDYGEILARQQSEISRSGKTVESLRSELEKTQGTIGRIQKAFSGDTEQKPSPYQQRMQQFDELAAYLDQEALESQKRGGQGLPITTKIGKQLAEYGREAEARAEKLEQELDAIKAQLKRQQSPALQGLERAAHHMEGMLEEALESLYGNEAGGQKVRAAQFNAVSNRINDEIKDLMKSEPETLLKIQRNPKLMRKMVNHFLAETIPPKARQIMDEERIKNEPIEVRDLFQAFAEAKEQLQEAQERGDERSVSQYSGLMDDIRRDILANQYGGRRGGTAERPTLNSLFSNFTGGKA